MNNETSGAVKPPIRVAVVDDQQVVREGFAQILGSAPDIEVVLQASTGRAFVDAVRAGVRLDVALVDIRMPILDGLAATRAIAGTPDAPAVVVVTTFDHDEYVLEAIAAGACGFLLKRCSGRELVEAVRHAADGQAVLAPDVTQAVLDRVRVAEGANRLDLTEFGLTPRERDVLALIGQGLNNAEIADQLYLSMSTVKSHVSAVLMRTGSRDRVQAAIIAIRAGMA